MKTPTEFEIEALAHRVAYDPVKAHEYYEKHKKLKGRRKGNQNQATGFVGRALARIPKDLPAKGPDPRKGKTKEQIHQGARARQRKELQEQIGKMEAHLNKLEALIKKRSHEEASEDRKSKAKKERAAKEHQKPKTAAEKAKAARESKKYKDKHKQELKSKAKKDSGKSGGSSKTKKKAGSGKHSVSELKVMATKVKGQIQAAKQKLAAL